MNRLFIIGSLLVGLVACKQPALEHAHQQAKEKGINGEVCYVVLMPYEIAGNYCLKYKGNQRPNIFSLPH